jgi:hypothetical protein
MQETSLFRDIEHFLRCLISLARFKVDVSFNWIRLTRFTRATRGAAEAEMGVLHDAIVR